MCTKSKLLTGIEIHDMPSSLFHTPQRLIRVFLIDLTTVIWGRRKIKLTFPKLISFLLSLDLQS
jgi:hypothetical protein